MGSLQTLLKFSLNYLSSPNFSNITSLMKITVCPHGIFSLSLIFLLLSSQITIQVGAQSGWGPTRNTNLYPYSRFSSSLAIIIAVLVTSIFFMIFFFIYIRYCTSPTSAVQRPVVLRATAAVRGLDASVIETFPTFSYSEVKDHQIGKGALECAVCLNEFEDDETLRLIPKCDHVFHPECIDAWLGSHVTCPVCRADLVPQPGDHPVQIPGPTDTIDEDCDDDENAEGRNSRNDEIVIQIDDENPRSGRPPQAVNRNLSFQYPNRPPKVVVNRNLSFGNPNRLPNRAMNRNMSFGNPNHMLRSSPMRPRMFGLGKLGRSHSAGNMLVQPGEDLERFTLRLPSEVRKEVIHRASLNRNMSFVMTPRESSRKGKTGVEAEGRMRADAIGRSGGEVKSDRWDFFTRALSMKLRSPRGVAETGESSGSTSKGVGTRSLNKLRSFNCLEPKAADETGLISKESATPKV